MKRWALMITLLASVAMILATPMPTMGKGKPTEPGGGSSGAGDAAGLLYGDLYVIERDGKGAPITREVTYVDSETNQPVTDNCLQPLAKTCEKLPLWGECGSDPMPDGVLGLPTCVFNPEANDPCEVYSTTENFEFVNMLQTVSFGRESVARSPASVLDHSYAEALNMINAAYPSDDNCASQAIKLDPAGRIMLCLPTEEDPDSHAWKTIDAPLENLGMYRAVMTDGCLDNVVVDEVGEKGVFNPVNFGLTSSAKGNLTTAELGHLNCNSDPLPESEAKEKADLLSAAVFLGAAADKTSPITLDEIINMNTYLGVNTYTTSTRGKDRSLDVTYYFPFTDYVTPGPGDWFAYDFGADACVSGGSNSFATLLTYDGTYFSITEDVNVFEGPPNGEDLNGVDLRGSSGVAITVCRDGSPLIKNELNVVCDNNPEPNNPYSDVDIDGCGGANWFAQAAEDARKTIWYLHNYEAPALLY